MSHRHLDPGPLTAGLPAGWAHDAGQAITALQDALASDDGEGTTCPVCLGATLVRDHGPGLLDRVSTLTAGLAQVLREAAPEESSAGVPGETGPTDDRQEGVRGTLPTHRPEPPTTVRIDVSD
ncbi:hypothetical protein GCM10022223_49220 [Kineosporia mesophila]|uniref:Uncharacterized protein n=1 Tax=Kineosporia mesophila TaxID=566012 RepID=A0ABP7A768_9ACTN|nr:hypothetical protein [Kineosporia mesophila]MCD5351610.1 hypothetical protein [Kineosporia mesophila]